MKLRGIEIVDDQKKASRLLLWHVRRSLNWIYPRDLVGLRYIRLIDRLPDMSELPADFVRDLKKSTGINGWYDALHGVDSREIVLHIPDIFRFVPRTLMWTTVPILLITKVLAHEVAHHLCYTRGYVFSPGETYQHNWQEEATADRYAYDLRREMLKNRLYWLGHEALQITVDVYYRTGVNRWKEKNYAEAARYWNMARELDPDHVLAAHWYWRAVYKLESEQG